MSSIYRPLDSTGRQIRLLNILPSKNNSIHLSCTLTYTKLEPGHEPYEALSYTWGYPEPNRYMLLDGQGMKIIESLEAALLRLRHPKNVRTLWTDAICINQADADEKANQIYLMDSIYQYATQVVVWLGEPDDGDRSAMMSLMVKNFSIANNFQIWRTQRKQGVQRGMRAGHNAVLSGEMDQGQRAMEAEIGLVARLLDRPWWRRVWIVQEVILAKKTLLMCGPDEVPWENVEARLGVHMYSLKSDAGLHHPLRAHNGTVIDSKYIWPDAEYNLLSTMQSSWRSGTWNYNLYDLLYQFRRLYCSLPQDRVFAYLGLVSTEQSAGIRVDYAAPIAQLYSGVAMSLIAAHKHLLVLNCKRESCPGIVRFQQTRLYSILDQGRFVDPQAMVVDEVEGKPREGWIRLPDGWERTVDEEGTWFRDHITGRKQRESPLKGQTFKSQTSEDFRYVPPGWRKDWDSLGKVKFTYLPHDATNDATIDLPSWVPNWNSHSTRDPEPLPMLSDADSCYWASGKNRRVHLVPPSEPDSSVLGVRGVLFDTIRYIASPWCPESEKLPISRSGVDTLKEWENLALAWPGNCPYKTVEGRFDAFWRTHIADYAGNPMPQEDRIFFNAWCDRTGWTPKTADLEQKQFKSLRDLAKIPSESMALGDMFLYVYERTADLEAILTHGNVTKVTWHLVKDSFAQRGYIKKRYKEVRSRIYRASLNRAMFVTSKGYIGLAPWNAKKGDSVVVLLGGCTPYILRPSGDVFTFVGETYVHGIMGGELFGDDMWHARLRDFKIV